MNWKCWFGYHKLKITTSIKHSIVGRTGALLGYDVYLIKKCDKCDSEWGYKTDYFWQRTHRIDVDYIKALKER